MIRVLLTAALLLFPAAAWAQPADATLQLFRDSCLFNGSQRVRIAHALELGWREADEAASPRLKSVLDHARAELGTDEDGEHATVQLDALTIRQDDHPLFLVLTSVGRSRGCAFYDFDAAGPLDPALINAWLHEEPAQRAEIPGSITGRTWNAFEIADTYGVNAAWLTPGGPASEQAGFSGLALSTTLSSE